MKKEFYRMLLVLVGLTILTTEGRASGLQDKFKKFVGSEFSNFEGVYIMGGIIVTSLLIYFLTNHFSKQDKNVSVTGSSSAYAKRIKHHQRAVIKKTP